MSYAIKINPQFAISKKLCKELEIQHLRFTPGDWLNVLVEDYKKSSLFTHAVRGGMLDLNDIGSTQVPVLVSNRDISKLELNQLTRKISQHEIEEIIRLMQIEKPVIKLDDYNTYCDLISGHCSNQSLIAHLALALTKLPRIILISGVFDMLPRTTAYKLLECIYDVQKEINFICIFLTARTELGSYISGRQIQLDNHLIAADE